MRISLKRILTAMLSALCIATIFFSSLSISSSSQVAAASTSAATMTGDYVNLRSGAGTNYSIIGSLSSGELVTVLDDSNPDWVKVQTSNGAIGYCSKEFVKTLSSDDEAEELIGTLTGDYVNLRAGAGTGHAVIGMLYLNNEVTVLDDSDANWAKIRTKDGQEGYCSKEYLHITKKGETAQGTAVTTDALNLRSGAGTDYHVKTVLSKGTTVTILDNSDVNWAKVRTADGTEGYCSKAYLDIAGSSAQEPSSPTQQPEQNESASNTTELQAVLTGSDVNLRSGAGTGYSVIGSLYLGQRVTVIDNSDANWAKIRTESGQEGYCTKEFLQISDGSGSNAGEEVSIGKAITTDYLNLRSGAGLNHNVLTVLAKGAVVDVIDNSDGTWVKVKTNDGTVGYCSKDYLQMEVAPTTVSLSETERTVTAGESFEFTATISDESLPTAVSTNAGAVQVTYLRQEGNTHIYQIQALQAGNAEIRISANGACASLQVTVDAAQQETQGKQATVNADYLNIRSGKGTDTSIIGGLTQGSVVTILDNSDANWVKIRTAGGIEGYVAREYLTGAETPSEPTTPETPSETTTATVNADVLNVRSGKGTDTSIIGTLQNGEIVTVLDNSDVGWVKIKTASGLEGYVAREYLTGTETPSEPTTPETPSETTTATVNADVLNVRSGKGTDTSIIGTLQNGEIVTVLDNSDVGWVKIKTASGLEGYVAREYLTGTETPSEPTTPETPSETTTATVNADVLNVRSGKGTDTSIVGTIRNGETVTVLDNSDATWVKIKTSSGLEGYVHRDYLNFGSNAGGGSSTVKYAQVTADVLNVRSGMGTEYSKIGSVSYGEIVEVLDDSNAGWAKIKTSSGLEGYVSKDYLGEVGENNVSNSVTIPAGKTYYAASSSGYWYSSNNSVATASNGYITAVAPGTCTITGSNGITYSITVTEGEAVRTAYASPNIAAVGETVEMVAVTDTTRDSVQFRIRQSDGTTKTVNVYDYTTEYCNGTTTRVWKASTTFSSAGTHQIEVYSTKNGVMSSTGYTTDAYTVWSTGANESSNETRRISDEMINLIASWEGYSSTVYPDNLAGGIPTIGYGQTFGTGVQFYNNMSKTEAWSLLVKSINAGSYTSEVNRFLQNNGIKATQSQFDALVSFSYNIGSGYWNGTSQMDLREIMLNAVVPPTIAAGTSLPASVTFQGARLYNSPSKSASVLRAVNNGTSVQVLEASYDSSTKSGWYKVQLSDGTVGYMCSGYVRFASSVSVTHDLNYVDAHAFGSEMLLWHHAGGNCYAGLVYRRMGEAKVFSYGDYASATPGNYEYQRNTYGYDIPDCIRGNGWIK
ncbi:MAG: SH3 domain-containing protein [Acutalibacteraceae bacterium]